LSSPDKPPILTLPRYRILVRSLPRPTHLQMQQFAVFVSNAHSWYKHLAYLPPGEPFQFFLDPGAGTQRAISPQGSVNAIPRTERGEHYSWLPTAEYRERFGYLAYSRSVGSAFHVLSDDGTMLTESDVAPYVYDLTARRLVQVPAKVLKAGRAFVSGVAHTYGADYRSWQGMVRVNTRLDWPEESGGVEAVKKILDRCRVLEEDPSRIEYLRRAPLDQNYDPGLVFVDFPLYQLLEPERQRQRAGMVAAMKRVIELVGTSSV
jgi:hypothetical protein